LVLKKDFDKWNKQDVIVIGILLNKYEKSLHTAKEMTVYFKKFVRWKYKTDIEMVDTLSKIKANKKKFDDTKINENNLITEKELERRSEEHTSELQSR
jgi:hypothetical protein